MKPDKLPSLEELEAEVKMITLSKHEREVTLMTNLMQAYIDGFNFIDSFTLTDDNEVQYAYLLLLTQSFHCMRCALLTMQIGYYGEAMSLLRTATEDWLAAADCQETSRTLEALLHNEKLELKWGNIAANVGGKTGVKGVVDIVYKGDYHFLSRFTHVSKLGLAIVRNLETNELRTRPVYDEVLFLSGCEMLIRNAVRMASIMLRFLSEQPDSKADLWQKAAVPAIQKAGDWLRERQDEYGNKDVTDLR